MSESIERTLGEMSSDIKCIIKVQEEQKDHALRLEGKVDKHNEDLAALKVKAGLWGFASGAIATIALALKLSYARGGQ